MPEVKFIYHKGKKILYQNLEGLDDVNIGIETFSKTEELVLQQPLKSVLLLTNVINAHYNTKAAARMKEFSIKISPHVIASAAVGVSGIKKVILQTLNRLSGRNIKICDTIDEACDWLVDEWNLFERMKKETK